MKHIFIINPISGNGKAAKVADSIRKVYGEENIDYQVIYTREPKDATEIVRSFKDSENIIYSVGGDGTLNEVVNGIVGSKNKLGVIPAGSGNDFYKSIKNIYDINPKIDVGMINSEYFINIASVGLDANIANKANQLKQTKISNNDIYKVSIIASLLNYKPDIIELNFNNIKIKNNFTIITICNGRYYGNGIQIAPYANVNDGLFDLYVVDNLNKLLVPGILLKLLTGTHEKSKYVTRYITDSIYIKSDSEIICNLDGEIRKNKEYKIKVLKKEIELYNNRYLIDKIIKKK